VTDADVRQVAQLERVLGRVLRTGVVGSAVAFAVGLLLAFANIEVSFSAFLLRAGVLVLMATPVLRVVVSMVNYLVIRDWTFVALTTIVLLELGASVAAALLFNERL
jgi:uncharacterized membrane protein